MCGADQAQFGCVELERLKMALKMVEYFLILAFEEPNHLSNTGRHQYYMFQINFIHGPKILSVLWYILAEIFESVCIIVIWTLSFSIVFNVSHINIYNTIQAKGRHYNERLIQNNCWYGPPSVAVTGTQLYPDIFDSECTKYGTYSI